MPIIKSPRHTARYLVARAHRKLTRFLGRGSKFIKNTYMLRICAMLFEMIRVILQGEAWVQSKRKRTLDLCLCALVLPFAAVVFTISALALCLDNARPIIFKQQRIGKNGTRFTIHKLVTLSPITAARSRYSDLLCVLGADETPQLLYDIWRGAMTTIGPRPLIPEDFQIMRELLGHQKYKEWYRAYTLCRPGWMGAFSQPSRKFKPQSPEYLYARYFFDTTYIRHASASTDLYIFFKSLTMWCANTKCLKQAWVELFCRTGD